MLDDNSSVIGERRKLENEMFSYEGDKRSFEKKKELVLIEITNAKKEIARLESSIAELELSKDNFEHKILTAEEEMARIKRKINLL
ncbi:MAG: hypothetical protein KBD27_02955 [Candidatus Moranbacteria bacterium]|nr:hypothetical protein [Candidatus Moranbacteria bacterium]